MSAAKEQTNENWPLAPSVVRLANGHNWSAMLAEQNDPL